ncbi:MAG TPA: hypothetical protein VG125_23475 [Pirellulales bacterium]|nr:hypothetical protein [Pirellulales bacterium]
MIDRQPRVTDLLPHRYSVLALVFFAGLTWIVGLEAAYLWLPDLTEMTGGRQFAALDLENEGALANWFSSTTLGLAAVVAAIIFSVRRHRQDDYHGRYRVWLWAAALWTLMSVDEAASLHEGLTEVARHFSGERGLGDGSIYWVAAYGLLFAAVGTRLFLEMRCCRLSSAALVSAVGCFVASVAVKIGLIPALRGSYAVMTEEGCEMLGDALLLFSMAVHARYTILDAQGALGAKARKPAKAAKSEKTSPSKAEPAAKTAEQPAKRSWFRRNEVDTPHTSPPPPSAKTLENSKNSKGAKPAARPATEDTDDERDDGATRSGRRPPGREAEEDYDFDVDRRLSKAERKQLRRQKDRNKNGES